MADFPIATAKLSRHNEASAFSSRQMLPAMPKNLTVSTVCSLLMMTSVVVRADDPVFETHVRPILKANCFHCHGEEETVEGKLDLRLARLITAGGDSGPGLVAGQPDQSLLLKRIEAGEMPPGEKKLTPAQVDLIRRWVASGAKTARPEPDKPPEGDFTEEERAFWSFQPIQNPAVPAVNDVASVKSPIDAFLAARLQARGLGFSAEADRATQLRRVYFDLVGLPPTPDDLAEFLADTAPDAFERLLDRLLTSPRYGERWGRHWLDVAGYADSEGYTEYDAVRLYAFKYRDYVIRSLNTDIPFDRFIVEQLAGDELIPQPHQYPSPHQADVLAATGFLRMAPDGTASGATDVNLAKNDVLAETIKIVSTSLLGMSVGCAQCHNHRYDPISQADYYRFRALFEPAYNWQNWRTPPQRLVSTWDRDLTLRDIALADAQRILNDQRGRELDAIVLEVFNKEVAKLPEAQQPLARAARAAPAETRTPEQLQILKDHPSLNVDRGSVYLYEQARIAEFNRQWDARVEEVGMLRPPADFIPFLSEVPGQIPPTFLFYRGEISQPKQEVQPGDLTVLAAAHASAIPVDDPALPTSGRRLAYAKQLTDGKHPLLTRVLVNRFWLHHFGVGIVATPGDFGYLGEKPSHPELLDWLATRFVADGWQLKKFHRMVMSSTAYRQQSYRRPELDAVDADNRLLGRMSVRRLEAEAIRDSILAASGALSDKQYGSPSPVTVDDDGQNIVGNDNRDSAGRPEGVRKSLGEDEFRRSVYVQVRRSLPLGMLEPFDMATLLPNCELRRASTVPPQALLMMNNELVLREADRFAHRVRATVGDDATAQVTLAWTTAFGKTPTSEQTAGALAFIAEQTPQIATRIPADEIDKQPPAAEQALANLCQALFSANAFLYVD